MDIMCSHVFPRLSVKDLARQRASTKEWRKAIDDELKIRRYGLYDCLISMLTAALVEVFLAMCQPLYGAFNAHSFNATFTIGVHKVYISKYAYGGSTNRLFFGIYKDVDNSMPSYIVNGLYPNKCIDEMWVESLEGWATTIAPMVKRMLLAEIAHIAPCETFTETVAALNACVYRRFCVNTWVAFETPDGFYYKTRYTISNNRLLNRTEGQSWITHDKEWFTTVLTPVYETLKGAILRYRSIFVDPTFDLQDM